MIVLEKWVPKKPISAIYYDGLKEKYFLKRFLIENENREEIFITEHKNSLLEIITTDWKPVIEIVYNKDRNKEQKPNTVVNIDEFISLKGIKAKGNQLTNSKVKQINLIDSIEFTPPVEVSANEIEVVDVSEIKNKIEESDETDLDQGQITLF